MDICERRALKVARQSCPLKIDSKTKMPNRFDSGVELLHRDLRRFSFTYQRFSLDITTVHYEDINENDRRVKFLWKALENFTNGKIIVEFCPPFRRCLAYPIFVFIFPDDRSRFLRFVTGRRRLPAPLYICPGRR